MPIYEFYCQNCNTIYKFFSRVVNTEKIPNCPKCENIRLERRVSTFAAISSAGAGENEEDNLPPIDETKIERAMGMLSKEIEGIDEEDPRQAARLMRKLSDAAGLKWGEGMEEAMSRLEKGEDPEKIEEEMGELLEEEEPFLFEPKTKASTTKPEPRTDETLYDL
ncbi:MAG: zinc ribbon domain-containing protein [Calditrichaeota bacterium]|nr:MAG: zinc ribbon domain-containing protein [Calditrichota bacterium]